MYKLIVLKLKASSTIPNSINSIRGGLQETFFQIQATKLGDKETEFPLSNHFLSSKHLKTKWNYPPCVLFYIQ